MHALLSLQAVDAFAGVHEHPSLSVSLQFESSIAMSHESCGAGPTAPVHDVS